MNWNLDYDTKKTALRVITIVAGIYTLFPDTIGPIVNYPILGYTVIRWVVGAAAILFAVGSFQKWW